MGFGNQGRHNYSFTTELHTALVYGGGDDDLWVFVDR